MSTWLIADLHFDDDNIRRYENRPFQTVEEMNRTLIENWNRVVADEDEVFLLGDVGEASYLKELKGHIRLLLGNHDALSEEVYRSYGVEKIYDLPIIWNNYWMLSHEPLYVNRNMPYANIFGHVHNNPAYQTVSARSYCVSVERIGYTPIAFEEIMNAVKGEEAHDTCH